LDAGGSNRNAGWTKQSASTQTPIKEVFMKGFKRTPIITGLLLACACLIFTSPVLAAGRGKAVSESLLPTELKKTEVADH